MEEASLNCSSREGRVLTGIQSSQDLFDVIKARNWEGEEKGAVAWEGQLLGSGESGLRWNRKDGRPMRRLLGWGEVHGHMYETTLGEALGRLCRTRARQTLTCW